MTPDPEEGVPYGRQLTIRAETDPLGPALTVIGRDRGRVDVGAIAGSAEALPEQFAQLAELLADQPGQR